MKIPIYAQLKSKLESKGLDSTTSGQLAWLYFSGILSVISGFFIGLYWVVGLNSADFISVFVIVMLFSSISLWSIITFLNKKFLLFGFLFVALYFISIFVKMGSLWIIGAFIIILFWFLCNKMSLKRKLLLCIIFLVFVLNWFILFYFITGQILPR